MRVVEVFYSLQGEGRFAGLPSVFIRLAGCPIRCRWCDTAYAWPWDAGVDMDLQGITRQVSRWPCRYVVITGGEPLIGEDGRLRDGIVGLTKALKEMGYHITIETAGLLFDQAIQCDLMSISPKPGHVDIATIRALVHRYSHQLKFLFPEVWQVEQIEELLEALGIVDPTGVMLMPFASRRGELLAVQQQVAEVCLEHGWMFCQRLHLLLWDGLRGR